MKYIVANWKMKLNSQDVEKWLEDFGELYDGASQNQIILCPSFPHLDKVSFAVEGMGINAGAQDVSANEKGSHTGDVGAFQLMGLCKYAIVGHSERKEPRDLVLKKRDICLENGITPIVCFVDIDSVTENLADGVLLAWEDPENIATDGVFKEKDPAEIKAGFEKLKQLAPKATILYGGSVHRENIQDLVNFPEVDGALLGTASLDPQHFLDVITAFE